MTKYCSYSEEKKNALYQSELKVDFLQGLIISDSFFKNIFFKRTSLDSPNIIKIVNKDGIHKLEKFLLQNDEYDNDEKEEFKIGSEITPEMKKIKKVNFLKALKNNTNEINKNNKVDNINEMKIKKAFADSHVSKINISVFVINRDVNKFGVIVFKFDSDNSNTITSIKNYATEIDYEFDVRNRKNSRENLNSDSYIYMGIISIIMVALLLIKYLSLRYSYEYKSKIIICRNKKKKKDNEEEERINNLNSNNNNLEIENKLKKEKKSSNEEKFESIEFDNKKEKDIININDKETKNDDINDINIKEISANEINFNKYSTNLQNKRLEKLQLDVIYNKKLRKVFSRSFFLILAWVIFISEIIYGTIHLIYGTHDAFFTPFIIYDFKKRDSFLFYKENIRLFKGIKLLFLCVHLIYVIFPLKKITIISKLFQKGLIIFYIIISIVILAISVFVYFLIGNYFQEFNTFTGTFIYLIGFSLGIDSTNSIDIGNVLFLKDYILYVRIIVYFIRLIVINFSLIVLYVFYRKAAQMQENKDNMTEEKEQEQEANRKRFSKLKKIYQQN